MHYSGVSNVVGYGQDERLCDHQFTGLARSSLGHDGRGKIILDVEDLMSDPDAVAVLQRLRELEESQPPDVWPSTSVVGEGMGLQEGDVLDYLNSLARLGLVKKIDRMVSGWRISTDGRRLAEQQRASRTSGRDRQEHTLREILRFAVDEEGGEFTRGEWEEWDLHESDLSSVALVDRESAMDALEAQGLISSNHSTNVDHVRCEVTARGRMALGRTDRSLADACFGSPTAISTTYDQRVGIQADTFANHGAVQAGDHNVQHVTITSNQRESALAQLEVIRDLLRDSELSSDVVEPISSSVGDLEQELRNESPNVLRLHKLRDNALSAAMGAVASEAGSTLVAALVALAESFSS